MAWHYVDLIIVYCFLAGILISGLKILKLKYFSYFLLLILFLLFLNRNINVYRNGFYFSLSPDQIKQSIIVKYIFDNSMGKPFNFKVFSSSPLNRDFSYLFWYYGNQYKNQNFNKGKIIYLIKENKSINPSKKIEKGIVLKKFPEYTVEKLINLK